MKRGLLLSLVVVAASLAACGTSGSGNLVTEDRAAGPFDKLEVSGALRVAVTVDPAATPAIQVTFDDNLIATIATRIAGDTLVIEPTESYNVSGGGRKIEVTTPTLTRVEVSGASNVVGFGETLLLDVGVSGASDLDFSSLEATEVTVDVSGASEVIVTATASATGDVSGASEVLVLGKPAVFDIESSGASDVGTG